MALTSHAELVWKKISQSGSVGTLRAVSPRFSVLTSGRLLAADVKQRDLLRSAHPRWKVSSGYKKPVLGALKLKRSWTKTISTPKDLKSERFGIGNSETSNLSNPNLSSWMRRPHMWEIFEMKINRNEKVLNREAWVEKSLRFESTEYIVAVLHGHW